MDGLDNFTQTTANLEQFSDVFKSKNIVMVSMHLFDSSKVWMGTIEYKTGDLTGKKDFRHADFKDLVLLMENFIKTYK